MLIIDYGLGNLKSVERAFREIGAETVVSDSPNQISKFDKIVVPGVGAFRTGIENLRSRGLEGPILEHVSNQRPILGICLGMQLMFKSSEEFGKTEGLGIFDGEVKRLPFERGGAPLDRIPNVGWRAVSKAKATNDSTGQASGEYYFTHSYSAHPIETDIVDSTFQFCGKEIVASVSQGSITAYQFHPEKSGHAGLALLSAFLSK